MTSSEAAGATMSCSDTRGTTGSREGLVTTSWWATRAETAAIAIRRTSPVSASETTGAPAAVGSYRLEAEIGRGPLGTVYRARQVSSRIPVALKVMAPELARNDAFCRRFMRDAELGPKLVHPHVVSILDCGRADDVLFCASRLVEGEDLGRALEREGPLEAIRGLRIRRQAASALDAAHESGIVHQNLKPQNLLLLDVAPGCPDVVYVSDFGLVRRASSDSTMLR